MIRYAKLFGFLYALSNAKRWFQNCKSSTKFKRFRTKGKYLKKYDRNLKWIIHPSFKTLSQMFNEMRLMKNKVLHERKTFITNSHFHLFSSGNRWSKRMSKTFINIHDEQFKTKMETLCKLNHYRPTIKSTMTCIL